MSRPVLWIPEILFPGVRRPSRDTDHSPTSSARLRMRWALPSLPRTSSWRGAWLSPRKILPFTRLCTWFYATRENNAVQKKKKRTFESLQSILFKYRWKEDNVSLCLAKYDTVKTYLLINQVLRYADVLGSGGITICILRPATRWRLAVSSTPRPIYLQRKSPAPCPLAS